MTRKLPAALLLANVWIVQSLAADPAVQLELTLRQALAAAASNNPLLQSGDDRVAVAEAIKLQAGLKPNPRVVLQTENARAWQRPPGLVFWRDTDTYIYGGQVIERGQKRERRIDYAVAGVSRAESERQLAKAQLHGRVASAYWNAVAAYRIVELYRQDLQTFNQIVEFNQSRFREGATAGIDLFRIEIERDRLTTAARRTEQEADLARISLLRELGRADFPQVVLSDSVDNISDAPVSPIEDVFRQRLDLRVAEAAVRQLEQNVALQKANAKTDPEIQLGYKRTAGFDTLYGAVNIPLAIRNRNQGNISAAEAEQRSALHLMDALRNQVRAECEAASRDYLSKRATFDQTIAPLRGKTREVSRIAMAAYKEGGVELMRFLDAERIRIETEVLYYRSLSELQQSIVTLKIAQGNEL